jgi:hypothetical protein
MMRRPPKDKEFVQPSHGLSGLDHVSRKDVKPKPAPTEMLSGNLGGSTPKSGTSNGMIPISGPNDPPATPSPTEMNFQRPAPKPIPAPQMGRTNKLVPTVALGLIAVGGIVGLTMLMQSGEEPGEDE